MAETMLNETVWLDIKNKMKSRNSSNTYLETMLENIEFVETNQVDGISKMLLGVPNTFFEFMVNENLMREIISEISVSYKNPFHVDLIVTNKDMSTQDALSQNENGYSSPNHQESLAKAIPTLNTQIPADSQFGSGRLNEDYVFSSFVVGRNAEFAHAASYNVARNPGADGYNPLFINGPVGMGKTHLLNAVGNQIKAAYPHFRITYVSAERFLNECVQSLRTQKMDKFHQKYRENTDVLLVDDVQFLKGERTQEEFFHTINILLERKCQVVVASDRMPKDIQGLEDRIRSRLEWGLIADITMPDIETRVAILRYKAEKLHIRLNDEVVNYIARISKRSIRELEGNLKKVKMFSELQGLTVDLDLVKRVLSAHESQGSLSIEDIQKLVADHYKVKVVDLKSKTRSKNILLPRQIAMYLIKRHLDKSLVDIGQAFGGRDHTTVINALEKIENLQDKDKDIKNDIEELTTRIHNITGL
jgi:chromosomal replication initiator protein